MKIEILKFHEILVRLIACHASSPSLRDHMKKAAFIIFICIVNCKMKTEKCKMIYGVVFSCKPYEFIHLLILCNIEGH